MKYSTLSILISLFICFLTLLICINVINIKTYKPAQIYVNQKNKYLFFSDEKDFDFFKNKKVFQAILPGKSEHINLYKQNTNSSQKEKFSNIIYVLTSNFNFETGWSNIFLYEKSETFLKHYLKIKN